MAEEGEEESAICLKESKFMAANLFSLHTSSFSTLLCLEKQLRHLSQLEHRHLVRFGLLDSKKKPTKILSMLAVLSLDSSDRAWRNLLASASLTVCPYIETGRGTSASSHTGYERTEQTG